VALGTVVAMFVVDPSDRSLTGESEVSGVSSEPVGLIFFSTHGVALRDQMSRAAKSTLFSPQRL
jgi:hypothetical protein